GRPAEALPHLREARERFQALRDPWWVAESMDWEAIALHMLEDPSALRVGLKALRRYRALEPRQPETEARMLEHLGTIYFVRRDYRRARASYEAALEAAGGVADRARSARVSRGLGSCHYELGDLDKAAELVFKAVTLYEAEQRIAPAPVRMDLPRAENDLGLIVMRQGQAERAETLLRSALAHYEAAGIERLQSHTLLSLAELRQREGRLDEALDLVPGARERATAREETYALTAGYRQLGEVHAARGEHALADASFQRSLLLCQAAGLDERMRAYMRVYERVLNERRQARRRAR